MNPEYKSAGIFLKVTDEFIKYLDETLQKDVVTNLRAKGYKIDRSVIGRFGLLLVNQDPGLLEKYPDLLLAAATADSSTKAIEPEEKILTDKCASCGDDWKTRKGEVFPKSAKTIPKIFGMQLLSKFGRQRIKLLFCDKHGNANLRHVTRNVNGTGVLQIRNVKTNRWRNAETIGVVV